MDATLHAYDYAYLRAVPRPHLPCGETIAVVLHARRVGLLAVAVVPDAAAVAARWPGLDAELLARALDAIVAVSHGGAAAAPIGLLPPSDRFHWLTAARSTVVQPTPVRTGLDADPAQALARMAAECQFVVRGTP